MPRGLFRPSGRRFAGFEEVERDGDVVTLENDLQDIQPFPDYVDVRVEG